MRVAIYHNLPPGGALRVVREFVSRSSLRHDCDVYTLDFGTADPFATADPGYRLRDLSSMAHEVRQSVPPPRLHLTIQGFKDLHRLRSIRVAEKKIAARINAGGYDVAFVHPCWFNQTPSILHDLEVPTVYFMQEARRATFEAGYADRGRPASLTRVPGWVASGIVERTLRRRDLASAMLPDRVLANSRFSVDSIKNAYGIDAQLTHLGVDDDLFRPGPHADSDRAPYVMTVGGLEAFKGHHLVVEALSLLPVEDRPELSVVYERCDLAYREALLAQAEACRVVVREHPRIPDVELATLYAGATATMLAAQREPLGLTALESIACGTPAVAIREGGYLETVQDGRNGFLVERSPTGLGEGLARLLGRKQEFTADEVRQTILPYWGLEAAVARQDDHLLPFLHGWSPSRGW